MLGRAEVLETIAEFRSASPELIAWAFDVPRSECERMWGDAIEQGLLLPDGACPQSGEAMYGLTALGESRLQELANSAHRDNAPGQPVPRLAVSLQGAHSIDATASTVAGDAPDVSAL